jgi:hypothetical protein
MRIESDRPLANGGWLHRMDSRVRGPVAPIHVQTTPQAKYTQDDLAVLSDRYERTVLLTGKVMELASILGLPPSSLQAVCCGWDGEAWTFPMRDATGAIVGFRRRLPSGRKLSLAGGHEGLFIPQDRDWVQQTTWIVEGPTDCATLAALGLDVIGRPSCQSAVDMTVLWASPIPGKVDINIIADNDEPGLKGALVLGLRLKRPGRIVRILTMPFPFKDPRDWYFKRGAEAQPATLRYYARQTRPL